MPDEIDEILKFLPKDSISPSTDEIDEVLKFLPKDPGDIGGTYKPTGDQLEYPLGKTHTEYVPSADPAAKPWAIIQAGFVDDPKAKMKIFSEERGLPLKRYRINKDNIEFLNSEGKWQREIPETPLFKLYKGGLQTVTNPAVIAGTTGAFVGGPKGAIAGAMGGELVRKGIGGIIYDEKQTPLDNLAAVGLEGLLATGGELLGAGIKASAQGLKTKFIKTTLGAKGAAVKYGGKEIAEGVLTPQEHAKALMIQNLADRYGIKLAPHQLYDKEGMTNIWMYLRKHPNTSDEVRAFEDNLSKASDEAMDTFIKSIGGYKKTPYQLGQDVQKVAQEAIESAAGKRAGTVAPLYKQAFDAGAIVNTLGPIQEIDRLMQKTVPKDPSYGALTRIKGMIESAGGNLEKLDRVKRRGIDLVLNKSKADNTLRREMAIVKEELVNAMDAASPEYALARTTFKDMSPPIDRLKESVVGEIANIEKDKGIAQIPARLFNVKNMPDAELLKEAKAILQSRDPKLWDQLVGEYIRDVYTDLSVAESGKVINIAGKLQKRLFGTQKQREIMEAALGSGTPEFKAFSDLMTIFKRASIGTQTQSMTAPFQAIAESLGEIPGSKIYRFAMFPRQAVTEWMFSKWNDILVSGRQRELLKALTSDESVKLISKMKPLSSGSKKLIETMSVFTALISNKMELENFWEGLPEPQNK